MGCDIHAYVDYENPLDDFDPLNLGKFSLMRNYDMFSSLAGVRSDSNFPPIVKPRGLPDRYSWMVKYESSFTVLENETEEEGCCSRNDAEGWGGNYTDKTRNRVWHPDWHGHSWLTAEEVGEVIDTLQAIQGEIIELNAIYHAMNSLVVSGMEPKFVFWFDN